MQAVLFSCLDKKNQKRKHSSSLLKITIIVKWLGNFGRRQCLALEFLCETDALIQIKEKAVDLGSQREMVRHTETWHGGKASNREVFPPVGDAEMCLHPLGLHSGKHNQPLSGVYLHSKQFLILRNTREKSLT